MEIFIGEQCKSLAESCIMGLIFGAEYDIIRILYVLWGIRSYRKKTVSEHKAAFWLFMAGDLLFMTAVIISASLFLYQVNHGQFRLFLVVGCVSGFLLYHHTVGRLVMNLSETIVNILKKFVFNVLIKPVLWIGRNLWCLMRIVFRITAGKIICILSDGAAKIRMKRCIRHFPETVKI